MLVELDAPLGHHAVTVSVTVAACRSAGIIGAAQGRGGRGGTAAGGAGGAVAAAAQVAAVVGEGVEQGVHLPIPERVLLVQAISPS